MALRSVCLATWNVDAQPPPPAPELARLFALPGGHEPVDLYVFGGQEVRQFDTKETDVDRIPLPPPELGAAWQAALLAAIMAHRTALEPVHLVQFEFFGSLLLAAFAPASVAGQLREGDTGRWCTRSNTLSGIKGAVAYRFGYQGRSHCITVAHLEANHENYAVRLDEWRRISSTPGFRRGPQLIPHHDLEFWLGDFNMRIDTLSREEVLHASLAADFPLLLAHDQLKRAVQSGAAFVGMAEGPIQFPPSYKFDPGTDQYDTSEKSRPPAWCDRVLWKAEAPVRYKCVYYTSRPEFQQSDHKPVVALLACL